MAPAPSSDEPGERASGQNQHKDRQGFKRVAGDKPREPVRQKAHTPNTEKKRPLNWQRFVPEPPESPGA
jgi:hypothetical protein